MIDLCISRADFYYEELAYRVYVTDILAHMAGTTTRYYDLIKPADGTPQITAQEAKDRIKNKLSS